MNEAGYGFLAGVLGEDGAKALRKAAERSRELENALVPRTILAWLVTASRLNYEGEIPGAPNTYVRFEKSEQGGYNGSVAYGDEVYNFQNASLYHVAGSVALSLGIDADPVDPSLRDADLVRLGKSIDLLAKARLVVDSLKKVEPPGQAASPRQTAAQQPDAPRKQSAIPKPPEKKPQPYTPPAPKEKVEQVKPIRLPGMRTLKVTKSQSERDCPECGGRLFKAETFNGCMCFRDLKKATSTRKDGEGYVLTFGKEWDSESIRVLINTLGG